MLKWRLPRSSPAGLDVHFFKWFSVDMLVDLVRVVLRYGSEFVFRVHVSATTQPRKRRRQQYHSRKLTDTLPLPADPKAAASSKKKARARNEVFEKPLQRPRSLQTIATKLQVLDLYEKLLKEKAEADQVLCAPTQPASSQEAKEAVTRRKLWAKQVKTRNLQKICREQFPLVVGQSQVGKWHRTSIKEGWRDLPAMLQTRLKATDNRWRIRLGLKGKGRCKGGEYPQILQSELDMLVYEAANGLSDVSERREVVTRCYRPR